MARDSKRDRWTWAVARTKSLHPTTRLFLSTCVARHMNAKGQICWPRYKLAAEFGITERRVSAHVQKAKEAGWLVVMVGGVRGHTAEYEATFPDANRVTAPNTLSEPRKGDDYKHPKWVTPASPYDRNRVTRTSPQVVSTTYVHGCSGNLAVCECLDCTEWRYAIDGLISSSHSHPRRDRSAGRPGHLRLVVA